MCKSRATHRALITCNTSGACHVQHIRRLSRATHRALVTCNTSGAYHVQHIGRLSSATHRALVTCNTSGAYHVQHIGRLSRATHRALITCSMSCAIWYEGTAQLLSLTELESNLALLYWLKRLSDERGGNRSTQRKPPMTSFRKCHIPKPENSSPNRDLNPYSSIDSRL